MMTSRPTRRARLLATASVSICGRGGSARDGLLAGAGRAPAGNAEGAGGYGAAALSSGPPGTTLPRALPAKQTA
jgi:hypothetical protein